MWRVIATNREGQEVQRVDIEVGDLSIGRDADRQMILASPSVSRRHCRVRIDGNGPVIMDEGSANGVIVNGIRITAPMPVNQMSRIEVAEFRLSLEQVGPASQIAPARPGSMAQPAMAPPMQAPMQPAMQPPMSGPPMGMMQSPGMGMGGMPMGVPPMGMPINDPSSLAMPMGQMPGMAPMGMAQAPMGMAPMQGDLVRLIAEGGPYDGRAFDLPPLAEISVGRAMDNDLVLDDPSLSRKHARLRRVGGGRLEAEDTNSANGTYVNGRKINPGSRQAVGPGDTLRFGELMFRVDGAAGSRDAAQPSPRVRGAASPKNLQIAFFGLAGVTVLVFAVALGKLFAAPPGPPKGAAEEAIARRIHEADPQVKMAQAALDEKNWDRAKEAADKALDIAPANIDAARIRSQAIRNQADEGRRKDALAEMEKSSMDGMEAALRKYQEISEGSPYREEVAEKLVDKLTQVGGDLSKNRRFREAAFMLCEAYRVAPAGHKPKDPALKLLRDAEKKAHISTTCPAQ